MSLFACALETLINERETELRAALAETVVAVSVREGWTVHHRSATEQFVARCPAADLERICRHFRNRLEWARYLSAREKLEDTQQTGEILPTDFLRITKNHADAAADGASILV